MNKKISAIITSGGSSLRFGSNKLLEKINDKSVIETTISKFVDLVDEIVVPAKSDIKDHILKSDIYSDKIKFALAGQTRQESVFNGLLMCDKPDYVLIHDGARPFIDEEIIKKTIIAVQEKKAVVVGCMAIDTIKMVQDGKIIKTLDRTEIFHAQTPQAFDYDLILDINKKCLNNEEIYTDDASMAESFGIDVFCIQGNNKNKKITTKDDLS